MLVSARTLAVRSGRQSSLRESLRGGLGSAPRALVSCCGALRRGASSTPSAHAVFNSGVIAGDSSRDTVDVVDSDTVVHAAPRPSVAMPVALAAGPGRDGWTRAALDATGDDDAASTADAAANSAAMATTCAQQREYRYSYLFGGVSLRGLVPAVAG